MSNLKGIVYLSQKQYDELYKNKSIVVNGETITFDENTQYETPDTSDEKFKQIEDSLTDLQKQITDIDSGGVTQETDPTVPSWAKESSKPTYTYAEIKEKPELFSGDYNDLSNKPNIPSIEGLASETFVNNAVANKATTSYVDSKAQTTLSDSKAYTDEKIDAIVGEGASETLDTIGEISKAIEENEDVVEALNNAIGTKANRSEIPTNNNQLTNGAGYITSSALDGYVDTEELNNALAQAGGKVTFRRWS